jgi:hypothetical protein
MVLSFFNHTRVSIDLEVKAGSIVLLFRLWKYPPQNPRLSQGNQFFSGLDHSARLKDRSLTPLLQWRNTIPELAVFVVAG